MGSPAVHHHGPRVGGVHRLHLLQELQHADGGERHPEVWPAGEVELGDQPRSSGALARLLSEDTPTTGTPWSLKETHCSFKEDTWSI